MREEGPPHPVLGSPLPPTKVSSPQHPGYVLVRTPPSGYSNAALRFLSSKRAPPPPSSWGVHWGSVLGSEKPPAPTCYRIENPLPHPGALNWRGHSSQEAQCLCPPQHVDGAQQGLKESPGLSRVPADPRGPVVAPLPWKMDHFLSLTPSASLGPVSEAVASVLWSPGAPATLCAPRRSVRPPPGHPSPCLGPGKPNMWPHCRPLCSRLP